MRIDGALPKIAAEPAEGIDTMTVLEGTLPELLNGSIFANADYACMLTNTTPDGHGLGNAVKVNCTFSPSLGGGIGTALVTNAAVSNRQRATSNQ